MRVFLVCLAAASFMLSTSAIQLPLSFPSNSGSQFRTRPLFPSPDALNFPAPEQKLASLSSEEYTTLSHAAFPGYGVRVKVADEFCDTTVKAYTGYLDVGFGARHLFFYFFESRSSPQTDDLLAWFNGGPGCSSALGLFMELGPCRVNEHGNGTVYNPYGWNDKTNLFFLDQPVGVGFSYADYGETIETTEDAAKDVAAFMFIFVETFAEFKGRAFHMAGESYGGRYLPVFASEIVDTNKRAVAAGITPINLKSVLIGNGLTDFKTMMPSYYDMACTNASVYPILDISTCVRMKRAIPRCKKMMEDHCFNELDELACTAALLFCVNELEVPFFTSGKNPYDISVDCEGPIEEMLCYPFTSKISKYLNMNETRKTIGVDDAVETFTSCSDSVGISFNVHMDTVRPNPFYISSLLSRGIDILIYVGSYDWICNWVGNMRWVEELEWEGAEGYNARDMGTWEVKGEKAGITKGYGGLVFATVDEAGHMVPYDKPLQALEMLNRWLEKRRL